MSRRVSAALAALALLAPAHASDADAFANATVGFEIVKPVGWHFAVAGSGPEASDFDAEMARYASDPLVAIVRHPEPFDDLNPTFKVNIRPLGELKASNATEILALIAEQFGELFGDLTLAERPRAVVVSGRAAAYMRVSFSLTAADGRVYPTASQVWIVPRGDYFFMIGAGTRVDERTGTRKEIQSILEAMRIAPEAHPADP